jgi:hypothetical protein
MHAPWDVENPPLIVLVYAPCEIEKCSFLSTLHGTWKMLLLKAWEIEGTPSDECSMGHGKGTFWWYKLHRNYSRKCSVSADSGIW